MIGSGHDLQIWPDPTKGRPDPALVWNFGRIQPDPSHRCQVQRGCSQGRLRWSRLQQGRARRGRLDDYAESTAVGWPNLAVTFRSGQREDRSGLDVDFGQIRPDAGPVAEVGEDVVGQGGEARSSRGEAGSSANMIDLLTTCSAVDNIFTRYNHEHDNVVEHVDSSPAVATFCFWVVPAVR